MQGAVNARELYLNGLKFILSFPIIKVDNKILMSRMDLSKLVEPVLSPAKISTALVHTVVLDAGHGGVGLGGLRTVWGERKLSLVVPERAGGLCTEAGLH